MIRTKPFGIVHVTTFTHFSDILFFLIVRRPPRSTRTYHSFPTRRAADLVSTIALLGLGLYTASTSGNKEAPKAPQASNLDMGAGLRGDSLELKLRGDLQKILDGQTLLGDRVTAIEEGKVVPGADRTSTRLHYSH